MSEIWLFKEKNYFHNCIEFLVFYLQNVSKELNHLI